MPNFSSPSMSTNPPSSPLHRQDLPILPDAQTYLYLEKSASFAYAKSLSEDFNLTIQTQIPTNICLTLTSKGLCLRNFAKPMPDLFFDLTQPKILHRLDAKRVAQELLLKAIKLKNTQLNLVVDATLGSGLDAILLTKIAQKVIGFEKNFYIFLLVQDAILRAKTANILSDELARLQIINADATQADLFLTQKPEVIYLDPMFSELNTKSQPKKNMNFMREILHETANLQNSSKSDELLLRAKKLAQHKLVIKRPIRAACDKQITYSLKGKNIRFDIYQLTTN